MNPFERPPMCWLLSAVKFICRRLLYVGIVIPVIAVSAFFVIPRVMQWCGPLFDPMTIVEPIQIPDSFKDRGYTEAMLQHVLVDTLSELREKAQGVTPATDTERVLTEFKLPDFSVPGTGLSVRPLIEFTRTLLKRDSSVYGSVIGSPDRFTRRFIAARSGRSYRFPERRWRIRKGVAKQGARQRAAKRGQRSGNAQECAETGGDRDP